MAERDPDVRGELGIRQRRLERMEKDLRTLNVGQVPVWNGIGWDGFDAAALTPEAWIPFSPYSNGWATQAGGQAAGYRKLNGKGYLRGLMTGAAATAITAFTLPLGYRPAVDTRHSLSYWDSTAALYRAGSIVVRTTGAVQIEDNTASAAVAANVTIVTLDPVWFWL